MGLGSGISGLNALVAQARNTFGVGGGESTYAQERAKVAQALQAPISVRLDLVDEGGASVAEAETGWKPFRFPLPPQGLSLEGPLRHDIALDLAGDVNLYIAPPGIPRMSLQGVFGALARTSNMAERATPGFQARHLAGLVEGYYAANQVRGQEGSPMARLVLRCVAPEQLQFWRCNYWVEPEARPVIRQSAAHPMDFEWSFTVRVLGTMDPPPPEAPLSSIPSASDLDALQKSLQQAQRAMAAVQELRNKLRQIRQLANNTRTMLTSNLREATDLARAIASDAKGIANSLNTSTLTADAKAQTRATCQDVRRAMGQIIRAAADPARASASGQRSRAAVVKAGRGLQEMAASSGRMSDWRAIATGNKLRHPYTRDL